MKRRTTAAGAFRVGTHDDLVTVGRALDPSSLGTGPGGWRRGPAGMGPRTYGTVCVQAEVSPDSKPSMKMTEWAGVRILSKIPLVEWW